MGEKSGLNACLGKTRYEDEEFAEMAAKALENDLGRRLKSYRCPLCEAWHLTSKSK